VSLQTVATVLFFLRRNNEARAHISGLHYSVGCERIRNRFRKKYGKLATKYATDIFYSVVARWSPSHRARLAAEWLTIVGSSAGAYHFGILINQPPGQTQPPIVTGTENKYQPNGGAAALWLGSGHGWFILFV